jgi:hypothetical protein
MLIEKICSRQEKLRNLTKKYQSDFYLSDYSAPLSFNFLKNFFVVNTISPKKYSFPCQYNKTSATKNKQQLPVNSKTDLPNSYPKTFTSLQLCI